MLDLVFLRFSIILYSIVPNPMSSLILAKFNLDLMFLGMREVAAGDIVGLATRGEGVDGTGESIGLET